MIIAVPRETDTNEARVSTTPHSAAELIKAGYTVRIESGAGDNSFFSDDDYQNVDAEIISPKEDPILAVNEARKGTELWHLFILCAFLLLCLETWIGRIK